MNKKFKKIIIQKFFENYLYTSKYEKKSLKDYFWISPRRKNFIFEEFEEIYWWQIDFWIKIYRKKWKKYLFDFLIYFSINDNKKEIYYYWETVPSKNIFQNKKIWNTKFFKEKIIF